MRRTSVERITLKDVLDSHYTGFLNTLKLLRQINDTLPQLAATRLDIIHHYSFSSPSVLSSSLSS
jgi:hypothetical protein